MTEIRFPSSWMTLPPTREEAKAIGLLQYFPPTPCEKCECRAPRSTKTGKCSSCKRTENSKRNRAGLLRRAPDNIEEAYAEKRRAERMHPNRRDAKQSYRKADDKRRSQGRTKNQLRVSRRPPNQSADDRTFLQALDEEVKRTGQSVDHFPVPFTRCHPLIAGLHVRGNVRLVSSAIANSRQPLVPMTDIEAAAMVEQHLAVWRADVDEATGNVDWSMYPWATA